VIEPGQAGRGGGWWVIVRLLLATHLRAVHTTRRPHVPTVRPARTYGSCVQAFSHRVVQHYTWRFGILCFGLDLSDISIGVARVTQKDTILYDIYKKLLFSTGYTHPTRTWAQPEIMLRVRGPVTSDGMLEDT